MPMLGNISQTRLKESTEMNIYMYIYEYAGSIDAPAAWALRLPFRLLFII